MSGPSAVAVAGLLVVGAAQVLAQNQLSMSGNPAALRIQTATAGLAPANVIEATTTFTVKTQGSAKKITAQLSSSMPSGVTLTIAMAAPPAATSMGTVALDASVRDIVVNLSNNANATRAITYTLSATPAAGVIASATRTVTFTLTAYP